MSRARFMTKLKEGLYGLPQPEIDDVISDYEFHFSEAGATGQSESDIVAHLGDPARLARELREGRATAASDAIASPPGPRYRAWLLAALLLLTAAGAAYYIGRPSVEKPASESAVTAAPIAAAKAPATAAPTTGQVVISGGRVLDLGPVAQDQLNIAVDGTGRAIARGHVKQLTLQIDGSGTVDFSALQADNVRLELIGSGEAEISALQTADITITGSGIVRLKTKPGQINRTITGSGRIILPD